VIDVVIVGAGMAGLSAGYELFRRGVSFVILESRDRPGGVVLSESVDGFTIDAGPDSLLVQKPEGIRLCEDVGLGPRLIPTSPPRLAFIQRGARLHPLAASSVLGIPTEVGPFLRTPLFTVAGKLRMGAEWIVPRRQSDEDESVGAFMTRRFGREATEYLAEPLLAGIHAGDVDRLSIRALFPRLVEAEMQDGSLLRGFRRQARARKAGAPAAGEAGAFRSLPGGLSELVRAVTAALPAGAVRLSTSAARVVPTPNAGGVCVETADGNAVTARAVILASPAYVTSRLLRGVDGRLADLCDEIPYASTATVVLAFPRRAVAHPLAGSGFVVPRAERSGILAASWLSSKWAHRAPADCVLIRAFVGGARDPEAMNLTDEQLVARSLSALTPLIGISGAPLLSRVYRWIRANAQHNVGHLDRLAAIDRALARLPGIFVTGSGFRGVGIPDCVADGRATAARVADRLSEAVR
jgi:oxygen-dependent protoporphyrinogen oxidase